jgi:hypothetical protein
MSQMAMRAEPAPPERGTPRRTEVRREHLWALLPPLLVVWMAFMHPLRRLDFWWHLRVGELLLDTRRIPRTDLFSFTRAGEPFLYQNWLGEVILALTHRAGGLPMLLTLNAMLLLLAYVLVWGLLREQPVGRGPLFFGSLLAALGLGLYSNVRPQVYSFVLFAAFYRLLWEHHAQRRSRLLWLVPLMVLWVNLHGAFVLGILLAGLFWAVEFVQTVWRGSPRDWTRVRQLGLVLLGLLAATLVNPAVAEVWAYVRQLQVDRASQQFVLEWQVPDIKTVNGVLLFYAPFLVTLAVILCSRKRLDLAELALFLAFAALGLSAQRNGIWFSLVVAPIVARTAGAVGLDRSPAALADRGEVHKPRSRRAEIGWLNGLLLVCMLGVTAVLSPWVRPHLGVERLRPDLVERDTPVDAADFIEARGITGRIFHPQMYGDYLIWRLWPQQRVFIDGRVHLYDANLVRDYILAFQGDDWETRLSKYDIEYLLLSKHDPSAMTMIQDARRSLSWSLQYEDQDSVLFARLEGD